MSHIHITEPDPIVWQLARHITSPDEQGTCIGLPRQYAPPPDVLPEPEPECAHEAHPTYHGVYLETPHPRRYYWAVTLDNGRTLDGYGYPSPALAAKAYDACVVAWALDRPLNFGASDGNPTHQESA